MTPAAPGPGDPAAVVDPRFDGVEAAMRGWVGRELLAGASWSILRDGELVDERCVGLADREAGTPLRRDHVFRVFSNTKLATSCAVLMLHDEGRIDLDEPVARHLPQLERPRVMKPGATRLDDTEPARTPITVRHLLTHSSGLSYGLLDPGTLMYRAYRERRVLDPTTPLSTMMDVLAELPLAFDPGTSWEYSVATDVLGRLVEVVSGLPFDAFLRTRLFEPLGMADTGFVVPGSRPDRLVAHYAGADPLDPLKPGLARLEHAPYPGAYLRPVPRLSGGGGLVSTMPDMVRLVRALLPGGSPLLKPATLEAMMRNQLPEGTWIRFAQLGPVRGKGYGLGGAVTVAPSSIDPPDSHGEFQWGGIAGTHWWISPRRGLAAVLMAQREMAFWHPFSFDFKQRVHAAA